MSTTELRRAGILARVAAGTLKVGSAALLMEVSYRQAKRVYRRYRAEGAKGLKHRSAGRASNRATDARTQRRVLALIREKYGGGVDERFGPTLAAEHLASEDGITVDHETLRRWMLAAGLWSRARKRSPHRRRRARMAHFGELVQLDGSFHPWFEDRGPHSCLLTLVDDATGRSLGRFGAQETIWAAVEIVRAWIGQYGIPRALYTDWKNVYVRRPNQEERETGAAPLTQFGRMCAALGIKIIPASSPQAKGRIERNHGTQQDRLVKKLRRKRIAEVDAANAFLAAEYWADHNARFAQAPASGEDFHVAVPRRVSLDQVFRLEQKRTVSNDWVVRYDNRLLQLERQSGRPPARSTVLVYETSDGQVEIRYRDRVMRWTELPALPPSEPVPPAAAPGRPDRPRVIRLKPKRVCDDHPWRRSVEQFRIDQQLAADRKAYDAVNP
ncbi:MAG: ISNCY family transposase [Acidimicrobiia bacterium]|nr:ISNCY family transposase [Acidimicrobiia bacterium]